MTDHAVGSRISLISKSDIRYEGFLHFINPDENTVGLKNVRMYGTEGRKGNPAMEVAARDQLYEFIIFRGNDIKDLTVFEDKEPAVDPAIVSMKQSSKPAGGFYDQPRDAPPPAAAPRNRGWERPGIGGSNSNNGGGAAFRHDEYRDFRQQQQQQQQQQVQQQQQQRQSQQHPGSFYDQPRERRDFQQERHGGAPANYERPAPRRDHFADPQWRGGGGGGGGRGNFHGHPSSSGRGRGAHQHHPQQANFQGQGRRDRPLTEAHTGRDFEKEAGIAKGEFKADFDFNAAKDDFEREKREFLSSREEAPDKGYSKTSSFFDQISCEALDKRGARPDRATLNKVDTETFGSDMVGSIRAFRGFRGGRGGRGGGGGRGGRGRFGNRN